MTEGAEEVRRRERQVIEAVALIQETTKDADLRVVTDSVQGTPKLEASPEISRQIPYKRGRLDETVKFKRVERVQQRILFSEAHSLSDVNTESLSKLSTGPTVVDSSNSSDQKPPQKFSATGTSAEKNRYWIPNLEINKKVITQRIQYYLGPESTVRPYTREVA